MVKYTRRKKRTYKRRASKAKPSGVYIGGAMPEKCIFIKLLDDEGLGNLLFIYAAGLMVKKKTGLPLCIVGTKKNVHSTTDYRTFMEGTPVNLEDVKERFDAAKQLFNNKSSFVQKWSDANIDYNKNHNSGRNVKLMDTLYQNYSSMHTTIPEVKESLMKHEFHKEHYKRFKTMIPSKHSAFMHIRRGDYDKYGWYLPIDYYSNALTALEKDHNIQKLYIISNDLAWSKEHDSSWKKHTTKPIEYLDGLNELETLYVMTLCEAGAIISNSTFSAWGVMMGADMSPHSTIIYPSPWLKPTGTEPNPLSFPERWIPIKNTSIT